MAFLTVNGASNIAQSLEGSENKAIPTTTGIDTMGRYVSSIFIASMIESITGSIILGHDRKSEATQSCTTVLPRSTRLPKSILPQPEISELHVTFVLEYARYEWRLRN